MYVVSQLFQSYFIQDYRWKRASRSTPEPPFSVSILLHSGLPLEGPRNRSHPAANRVSILLHSGLPLEASIPSAISPAFWAFQSYFIQDYRWKSSPSGSSSITFQVSILLHSGLPLEVSRTYIGYSKREGFNPTSFRITVGRPSSTSPSAGCSGFQSYFIQDYRWKWPGFRLPSPAGRSFNPTSFRITVGSSGCLMPTGIHQQGFNPTSFRITVGSSAS